MKKVSLCQLLCLLATLLLHKNMKELLNFTYMETSLFSFFKVFKSLHPFISQKSIKLYKLHVNILFE